MVVNYLFLILKVLDIDTDYRKGLFRISIDSLCPSFGQGHIMIRHYEVVKPIQFKD